MSATTVIGNFFQQANTLEELKTLTKVAFTDIYSKIQQSPNKRELEHTYNRILGEETFLNYYELVSKDDRGDRLLKPKEFEQFICANNRETIKSFLLYYLFPGIDLSTQSIKESKELNFDERINFMSDIIKAYDQTRLQAIDNIGYDRLKSNINSLLDNTLDYLKVCTNGRKEVYRFKDDTGLNNYMNFLGNGSNDNYSTFTTFINCLKIALDTYHKQQEQK